LIPLTHRVARKDFTTYVARSAGGRSASTRLGRLSKTAYLSCFPACACTIRGERIRCVLFPSTRFGGVRPEMEHRPIFVPLFVFSPTVLKQPGFQYDISPPSSFFPSTNPVRLPGVAKRTPLGPGCLSPRSFVLPRKSGMLSSSVFFKDRLWRYKLGASNLPAEAHRPASPC